MPTISTAAFLNLAAARTGHFSMESGLHSAVWLDLDALFAEPRRIEPFIADLADRLRPHRPDAVCGPLLGGAFLAQRIAQILGVEFWYSRTETPTDTAGLFRARYRLPAAFATRLRRPRIALVDDVMSAGSSLRATHSDLADRTDVVVVGALLQLGDVGADFFATQHIPVVSVAREAFQTWAPSDCPQCAAAVPLELVNAV